MTTKENGMFLKQQRLTVSNQSHFDKSIKFSNLNLLQSHKFSSNILSSVHSFSKLNNVKNSGNTVTHNYQENGKTWNKSAKNLSLKAPKNLNHFDNDKNDRKRWKMNKKNSLNSSTLSLHIAAYENSIEDDSDSQIEDASSKSKAFKVVDSEAKFHLHKDLFEFPRQLDGNEPNTPQIMQFKASQNLFSPNQESGPELSADDETYGVPDYEPLHDAATDAINAELTRHSNKIHDLSTANAVVILIFMVLVLIATSAVTGLIYYHYSNRTRRWVKITKTMHQRLSKQILREEKLKELCQIIGASGETINADRKELCPDIEEMVDLPAARYVDPFRAPSNMYEQIAEKDEDAKTLKNIDPDVFLKKDDMKSSGGGTSTNPSGKAKDKDPPTAATAPAPTPSTPAAGATPSTPAAGGATPTPEAAKGATGNAQPNAPPPGTPSTPATPAAPATPIPASGEPQKPESAEPSKPEEKKADKPAEEVKSLQA